MGVFASNETQLPFGDFSFEGNVEGGRGLIGIERKTIRDLLSCIDDARLSAHQKLGMNKMYSHSYVILEGLWRSDENGFLMEGYRRGASWGYVKVRGRAIQYKTLYRYLISLQLAGMPLIYSMDLEGTAINVVEHYHYFQKKWKDHTAMLQMQKIYLPSIGGRPTLLREWAAAIDDVGQVLSTRVEKYFGTPQLMALADEDDWEQIEGIGAPSAKNIVRQITKGR